MYDTCVFVVCTLYICIVEIVFFFVISLSHSFFFSFYLPSVATDTPNITLIKCETAGRFSWFYLFGIFFSRVVVSRGYIDPFFFFFFATKNEYFFVHSLPLSNNYYNTCEVFEIYIIYLKKGYVNNSNKVVNRFVEFFFFFCIRTA